MKFNPAKVLTAAMFVSICGTAQAAHESSNRFDFKPVANGISGDGMGISNYIAGASSTNDEVWNSQVQVSGLMPKTVYTFWAENADDVFQPAIDVPVCSFTTDARGDGMCNRQKHNEPALAIARIRRGYDSVFGAPVLEARRMPMDDDNQVDDGEIESSGENRDK